MEMTTKLLAQKMYDSAKELNGVSWVCHGSDVYSEKKAVNGNPKNDFIAECEAVGGHSHYAEFIALTCPSNVLKILNTLDEMIRQRREYVGVVSVGGVGCEDHIVAWSKAGQELGAGSYHLYTGCEKNSGLMSPAIQRKISGLIAQATGETAKSLIEIESYINELVNATPQN